MTLGEMLARMTSVELSWWQALYLVEGEERLAQVEAASAAAAENSP